ncbi:MAG: OadG family protein [Spirochaetaceae bacterium]|jgi:Na+-transporting methylmalonyl-CoA/oxaloacetate decarboxylase gamma subunit|nr:OadG family protein [Spirochaetaceae bacterium]
MDFLQKGLQNIIDNDGYSLSIAGMGIVFFSLAFIALIIKILPFFLFLLDKIVPEKKVEPVVRGKAGSDKGAIVAAIAGAIYKKNKKIG